MNHCTCKIGKLDVICPFATEKEVAEHLWESEQRDMLLALLDKEEDIVI